MDDITANLETTPHLVDYWLEYTYLMKIGQAKLREGRVT